MTTLHKDLRTLYAHDSHACFTNVRQEGHAVDNNLISLTVNLETNTMSGIVNGKLLFKDQRITKEYVSDVNLAYKVIIATLEEGVL